jgi:hypothetical protein
MGKTCLSVMQSILAIAVALGSATPGWAMPNFARQTSMSCDGCHTVIPRLSEDGFQFRKAGFRLPSELGKGMDISFGHVFAARIQTRYDLKHRNDSGTKSTNSQITLHEITLYPLSGAFGKHYASLMELSILNEDFVELENAYFRYSKGSEDAWWSGRVGIFHPFEGYGASDRPFSISRPLFQTTAASYTGSTFFTPWNFDQAGLEMAIVHDRTSISGTVFNGLFVDEAEAKAFPAAGGNLQKPAGFERTNAKDFQLFANQILKPDGSGISGFFYYGQMDLPKRPSGPIEPDSTFGNSFYRVAGYASWMLVPKLGAQGGYQWGKDHFYDPVAGNADDTFESQGYFGEVDASLSSNFTAGARYDYFDPSRRTVDNELSAVTLFANVPMNDGLQGIAEFKHQQKKRGSAEDLKDDTVQLRVIWIW